VAETDVAPDVERQDEHVDAQVWVEGDPADDEHDPDYDRALQMKFRPRIRRALSRIDKHDRTLQRVLGSPIIRHQCVGRPAHVALIRPQPRCRRATRPAGRRRTARSSANPGDPGAGDGDPELAWRHVARHSTTASSAAGGGGDSGDHPSTRSARRIAPHTTGLAPAGCRT
jgi:hypothetical protein